MIKMNENPRNNFDRQMGELCKTLYNNFVARTNSLYYSSLIYNVLNNVSQEINTHLILI